MKNLDHIVLQGEAAEPAQPVNQLMLAALKAFVADFEGCYADGEPSMIQARAAIVAAEQVQDDDAEAEWRRLALQFDGHRMKSLAHLRCLLENPESHADAVRAFLAAPPLSGEQVLADRIAVLEQDRAILIDTHQKIESAYAAHVEKLATHSNELEQDATRYRWIRTKERFRVEYNDAEAVFYSCLGCAEGLDAAIDDAISES